MYSIPDTQLATKLLEFSTDLKQGQSVLIECVGLEGVGLVRALVEQVRQKKAFPYINLYDSDIRRMLLETGDKTYWQKQADLIGLPVMKEMDAYIGIRATPNIYESSDATREANKAYEENYAHPVHLKERVNHTNWVVLRYPTSAFAMNAKMPTERFRSFFYDACLLDYKALREKMKPLQDRLKKTDMIRLVGEGTDISFSVKGQNWIPCFGERNIPDGELFSSPILDSVNGTIRYAPSVYQGKPFEFVSLTVKDGVVIDSDSSNPSALNDILATDEGAKRFGEFSFGLNPKIESPMYDILFDEKIYGSNHLTLGQDYEEASNGNKSLIHWDLVCIGPDVYLDDDLVRKGRYFVKDDLLPLNPSN